MTPAETALEIVKASARIYQQAQPIFHQGPAEDPSLQHEEISRVVLRNMTSLTDNADTARQLAQDITSDLDGESVKPHRIAGKMLAALAQEAQANLTDPEDTDHLLKP